jgi:hypothetical protein
MNKISKAMMALASAAVLSAVVIAHSAGGTLKVKS